MVISHYAWNKGKKCSWSFTLFEGEREKILCYPGVPLQNLVATLVMAMTTQYTTSRSAAAMSVAAKNLATKSAIGRKAIVKPVAVRSTFKGKDSDLANPTSQKAFCAELSVAKAMELTGPYLGWRGGWSYIFLQSLRESLPMMCRKEGSEGWGFCLSWAVL